MQEQQKGHVMVTKAYAAAAAERGIHYPEDWVLGADQGDENQPSPPLWYEEKKGDLAAIVDAVTASNVEVDHIFNGTVHANRPDGNIVMLDGNNYDGGFWRIGVYDRDGDYVFEPQRTRDVPFAAGVAAAAAAYVEEYRRVKHDEDADAVLAWATSHPDADLFAIVIAENIGDDDPDWVDDEWTLERVERALKTLADEGRMTTTGKRFSAGVLYALPAQQKTYLVPTRQTIIRTYTVTAESHEEAKAMVESMLDNWEDDERAEQYEMDMGEERLCGGSEQLRDCCGSSFQEGHAIGCPNDDEPLPPRDATRDFGC